MKNYIGFNGLGQMSFCRGNGILNSFILRYLFAEPKSYLLSQGCLGTMDRGRGIVKRVIEFYTAEPSFIALTIPQLLPWVSHTDGHLLNLPFSLAKSEKHYLTWVLIKYQVRMVFFQPFFGSFGYLTPLYLKVDQPSFCTWPIPTGVKCNFDYDNSKNRCSRINFSISSNSFV